MTSAVEPAPAPRLLRAGAGVVLLTALFVVPLNYGSTRPAAFLLAIALVAVGTSAWLLASTWSQTWSVPPPPALIGAALVGTVALLGLFWLTPEPLPAFTARHYSRVADRWPLSVVARDPRWLAAWALVSVGALFALADLARAAGWRIAVASTVVLTGVLVAILGLVQNATRAKGIYWEEAHRMPGAFFGPFFHHTAAGAYLNTTWPLALMLALKGFRHGTALARSAGAAAALAGAIILGAHTGHVSRLPQVVALGALVGLVCWLRPWRRAARSGGWRIAFFCAAIVLPLVVFVSGGDRLRDIRARWTQLEWSKLAGHGPTVAPVPMEQWPALMRDDLFIPSDHRGYPLGDRGATYATAARAIVERPLLGWGLGGWTAAAAAHSTDPFVRTFYLLLQFTHQDYLQTLVEWGIFGAAGWALLVIGAVACCACRLRSQPERDLLGVGTVAGLVAVLTQSLIDFPMQIPAIQLNALALSALAWSTPAPAAATS